jgi:hypothetical protein
MAASKDIDKAITHIMDWAAREDWVETRAAVFDEHFGAVCRQFDLSREDLYRTLEAQDCMGMLFGWAFEDSLARTYEPDERNVIADYLKRRGWRESPAGRQYLEGLRRSVASLYEVVEVSPGHHVDLRDLVRGGDTFRVHERLGTQTLVRWDKLAARVIRASGKNIFSGALLPFPKEAADALLDVLQRSRKRFIKELGKAAGEIPADSLPQDALAEFVLRHSAHAFTAVWLGYTLKRLRQPLPELSNSDGEALMFTETRFPVHDACSADVEKRLDAADGWVRAEHGPHWSWLRGSEARASRADTGMSVDAYRGGERTVLGHAELEEDLLIFSTNSNERAERGKEMLASLLSGLVGAPLTAIRSPEQLLAESRSRRDEDEPAPAGERSISAEEAEQLIRDYKDRHYRDCLDQPIPALGGKSPIQCARSKQGRYKVIEWLKLLENHELREAAAKGATPYDFTWLWEELKLTPHRR